MADDEYQNVAKGKLKLKTDGEMKKKKKKKSKDKEKEKLEKIESDSVEFANANERNRTASTSKRPLTQAEQAFKQMQEKMQKKRISDKAAMTHKQRVEKFNQHLDSLTEHFDIPKVSWTK